MTTFADEIRKALAKSQGYYNVETKRVVDLTNETTKRYAFYNLGSGLRIAGVDGSDKLKESLITLGYPDARQVHTHRHPTKRREIEPMLMLEEDLEEKIEKQVPPPPPIPEYIPKPVPSQEEILNAIMNEMKIVPRERPRPPQERRDETFFESEEPYEEISRAKGRFPSPSKIFPADTIRHIDELLRKSDPRSEIEVSFGNFSGKRFFPGVTQTYFLNLKKALDRKSITELTFNLERSKTLVETFEVQERRQKTLDELIRKVTNLETSDSHYELKLRNPRFNIGNQAWGYRFSKSTEEIKQNYDETNFFPNVKRFRERYSYEEQNHGSELFGVRFDLTIVNQVKTINRDRGEVYTVLIYEVEIEKTGDIRFPTFELAVKFVLGAMSNTGSTSEKDLLGHEVPSQHCALFSNDERLFATDIHNAFFEKEIQERLRKQGKPPLVFNNPFAMYQDYWNKPENMKLPTLLYPQTSFAVTLKLDGVRRFVLVNSHACYMYNPPTDAFKVGAGNFQLAGTFLDGELVNENGKQIYYAFDILFDKGKDVRMSSFDERLASLQETDGAIVLDNITYRIKKYFKTKSDGAEMLGKFAKLHGEIAEPIPVEEYTTKLPTLYADIRIALREYEMNPEKYDGLIFQPIYFIDRRTGMPDATKPIWYKNTKTLKWKPPGVMTIDFLLEPSAQENLFILKVSGSIGKMTQDVPFMGSKRHPLKDFATIYVPDGTFENLPVTNEIMECTYNASEGMFEIFRRRIDRTRPNWEGVASDVWDDIMEPIPLATLEGNSLQVARKFFNQVKLDILKTHFRQGDSVVDIGSGRGGDLLKYAEIKLRKVYALEKDQDNLDELKRRLEGLKEGNYDPIVEPLNLDASKTADVLNSVTEPVNGVVAFFSLTFFSANKKTYDGLLETIDKLLVPGGKFVGIVMDGHGTFDLLEKNRHDRGIEPDEPSVVETESFSIEQLSEFDQNPLGNKIKVTIKDPSGTVQKTMLTDDYPPEYLFYFNQFVTDLKKKHIALLTSFLINKGPIYESLPPDSKVFSSLNRVFVFEREK